MDAKRLVTAQQQGETSQAAYLQGAGRELNIFLTWKYTTNHKSHSFAPRKYKKYYMKREQIILIKQLYMILCT